MKRYLFVMPCLLIALQTAPATAGGTIGSPGWTGGADAVQVAQFVPESDIIELLSAPQERPIEGTRGLSVETVPAAPPPPVRFHVEFAFGSANLTDSARRQLDELGRALVSNELSPYNFRISGHTDATGTERFNLGLSERRAISVRNYLSRNYAISGGRLDAIGLGESAPAVPGDPFDPSNRRVEITNMGTGG
ncbi:MAG: OmpA family protein [Alphaproteobacteria bacterium]